MPATTLLTAGLVFVAVALGTLSLALLLEWLQERWRARCVVRKLREFSDQAFGADTQSVLRRTAAATWLERIAASTPRFGALTAMLQESGTTTSLQSFLLGSTGLAIGLGFCSQSGAIGAAVLNSLRETDIRFSQFISVGNKADVTENDLLEFWEKDKNVSVITYYLESFEAGEKFLNYFIEGKVTKPVIILKGGRTSSGIKAASSHTGALGSSDKVVDAVLKQFGIIRADDLNDMFNTAKGFEDFPMPKGNRIAVITNAGGPAILTVDTLERNNLSLAELSPETKAKLKEIVPSGQRRGRALSLLGGLAVRRGSATGFIGPVPQGEPEDIGV